MIRADFGTIIHSTTRAGDLVPAFISELDRLLDLQAVSGEDDPADVAEISYVQEKLGEIESYVEGGGCTSEDVGDLMDLLHVFAPDHSYFGSHPGDHCDYGFWPNWEGSLSEIPQVSDPAELDHLDTDEPEALCANGHGSATLYARDGSGWRVVWSIV